MVWEMIIDWYWPCAVKSFEYLLANNHRHIRLPWGTWIRYFPQAIDRKKMLSNGNETSD